MVPHGLYLLEQLQIKARPLSDDDKLVVFGGVSYDQPPGAGRRNPPSRDLVAQGSATRGKGSKVQWPLLPGTEREMAQVVRRWQANAALWPKWSPGQRGSTVARYCPKPAGHTWPHTDSLTKRGHAPSCRSTERAFERSLTGERIGSARAKSTDTLRPSVRRRRSKGSDGAGHFRPGRRCSHWRRHHRHAAKPSRSGRAIGMRNRSRRRRRR